MSNFFIVGKKGGPVTTSLTESQKAQIASYGVQIFSYDAKSFNFQVLTEAQKAQISVYAITVLGYGTGTGVANSQTLTESQKAQISYAVTNLSYA